MRLKNRLNNWISIRMGMVIVIFLGVSCGSMRSSTPPPAKDRLTEIDSLERLLPDCPTIASTLPLLRRLAFLYQQQSEMRFIMNVFMKMRWRWILYLSHTWD